MSDVELLNALPDSVAVFGPDWTCVRATRQARRVLGISAERLEGLNVWDAYPEAAGTTYHETYTRVMLERVPAEFLIQDPPLRAWYDVRAVPYGTGVLVVSRDVTAHHRDDVTARVELRALLTEAHDAAGMDLLPLTRHVDHFVKRAQGVALEYGDAELKRQLDVIGAASDRMASILRTRAAVLEQLQKRVSVNALSVTRVDLGALLQRVIASLQEREELRAVEWSIEALPVVEGDADALERVLANIVSNAMKFTRDQRNTRILVRARQTRYTHDVSVTDNGSGFDEQERQQLFRMFSRLARHEAHWGKGVGLAVVKRLVQQHGGAVGAEGRPGVGAAFSFSLPRGPDATSGV